MTTRTLLFNLVLLAVVGAWGLAFVRRPTLLRAAAAAIATGLATLAAAGALGWEPFDMARLTGWTWFLHAPLLFALFARALWAARRRLAITCIAVVTVLEGTAVYAYHVEPRWLEITRVRVVSREIDRPLRVGLVADIQTDRVGAYERHALRALMRERPDLLAFAGDYIQTDGRRHAPESAALRDALREERVGAPLGVYVAKGNVDPVPWEYAFSGLGFSVSSETRTFDAGPVSVTTLSEEDSFDPGLTLPDPGGFHIVVGHAPDYALGSVGADLLLAGHTHGGQVRLPLIGPIVTASALPRDWAHGVTTLAPGKTLVVSRGVGMERSTAPRIRFLCRPEIVVVDVVPG